MAAMSRRWVLPRLPEGQYLEGAGHHWTSRRGDGLPRGGAGRGADEGRPPLMAPPIDGGGPDVIDDTAAAAARGRP